MKLIKFACLIVTSATMLGSAQAANDQQQNEAVVPLFLETCLRNNIDANSVLAAVTSSKDWAEVSVPSVELANLEKVPSRLTTSAFRKPGSLREWRRTVNQREITLVIANWSARKVYRHACVILISGIPNAMPYFDAMKLGMREIGLSGKSIDLPHYQEFSGRLPDRRRAHVDIFSRSSAMTASNTMHLAIIHD